MANISISGTVSAKPDTPPVTTTTYENPNGGPASVVSIVNVCDRQFVAAKNDNERLGQFYRCEFRGRLAEVVADRAKRGDKITVYGQLVQKMYQDKLQLNVTNCSVTFLESAPPANSGSGASDSLF